jgi:hypothetical protein
VNPEQEEFLRRLALNDESVAPAAVGTVMPGWEVQLAAATFALVRVAALIASDAAPTSYQWAVDAALAAGATEADIVDVLVAVSPLVGFARVGSAAPELALALGYDISG